MVMKDKLTKNYHKGSYYRNRRILFTTVALITGVFAVSIPTYINSIARNTVKAEVQENNNSNKSADNEVDDAIESFVNLDKQDWKVR